MLLMPLVTVALSAVLDHEAITAGYLIGGPLVLIGVYVGAFAQGWVRAPSQPPTVATPGCS